MCASEEVQLAALTLFSAAVSASATSPASLLERALHCGLSDYLIEATRSASRRYAAPVCGDCPPEGPPPEGPRVYALWWMQN